MVSTRPSIQTPAWAKNVLHTAQEFGPTPLSGLSGQIPTGLRGSLYRNGPGRLERGGQHVGHWFDGDGGILGIHFTDAGAIGLYRYVQTDGYQRETAAGRLLFAGYGMTPPGPLWQRWGKALKNAANTSVLALPDKLLALWEGGPPHCLTLDMLETQGTDDLDGLSGMPFSAHPKTDPITGEIFNFGVSLGTNASLNLYRSDRMGKIQQRSTVVLNGLPIVHDFVLAGNYLVFCVPPVRISAFPVLLQLKAFADAMSWKPELGSEIIVIDRHTLQVVSRIEAEPWYQWHFGNGCALPDGSVMLSIARYEDFQTNDRLREISFGQTQTPAIATLWQLQIDPKAGKVLEFASVLDRSCEFPVVQPHQVGQPWRYTYLTVHAASTDTTREVYDTIARFDAQTGNLTTANMGKNHYPTEALYAPDTENSEQGWLLTIVYDSNTNQSEAWIYAADRLDDDPVCRLLLPEIIPLGFHGTWKPA